MAEERLCLCSDILQQQPAEAGILLAYAGGVCLLLSGFAQHLLLQRSEGCGSRPSASEEMSSPDCLRKSLHQKRLRDDDTLHDWCLGSVATGPKSQYTLFIYDRGGLLADEYRLLYPSETICHPGCVDHCHWVCDASVGRWCYD